MITMLVEDCPWSLLTDMLKNASVRKRYVIPVICTLEQLNGQNSLPCHTWEILDDILIEGHETGYYFAFASCLRLMFNDRSK